MTLLLSLITHPQTPVLTEDLLIPLQDLMKAEQIRILCPGIAVEVPIDPEQIDMGTVSNIIGNLPVDINMIHGPNRRKKLLIADMDSTMIQQECIDELAAHIGKYEEIAAITEQAMRGELDFDSALKKRVGMLKGLNSAIIDETYKEHIDFTSGAKSLVHTMNRLGAYTALVSGGFTDFTGRVAEDLGFHYQTANQLLIKDGVLTGEVAEPILGRAAKAETLMSLCEQQDISPDDCIAVGDGANDLDMLGLAGMGVAFHAKPATAAAADIQINHGDLSALLYLQGIEHSAHDAA